MMEDATLFEHDDAPPSISQRAIKAREEAESETEEISFGIANGHLNAAIMAVLKEINKFHIDTDKDGAHKVKYATLKQILETVAPALHKQGVRIRQGADRSFMLDEGGGMKGRLVPVYTDLIHVETGQVERTTIEMPVTRLDPQAMGSAITYGKRYTLLAALGLATAEGDDDGEAAKPKSLNDEHRDSADLLAMTAEMSKQTDLVKLEDWTRAQGKRFNTLSDEEQAIMKTRKSEYVRKLMAAPDEPKKASSRKAAE